MQCKKEENAANCSCTFPDCPRKGMCCECVAHHKRKNEIPACLFPIEAEAETMNDRSFENFVKAKEDHKKQMAELGN
ncbi:MAG TPA: DUF6485 family protein [Candidatus Moranbacteria bacterium]|nr:DUF6485 family protein [Candidatus Moranbacteria bacterium]HRY28073.1 DUF6485 family protein [Candidatus Moranbacteria bacterium]HSA08567.1 DUF6485 family protein [Candidatus Moranbacteria bacterium]